VTQNLSKMSSVNALAQAAPAAEFHHLGKLAPIALFVYNRAEHTRRSVEALQKNDLAKQSDLFVFADGPKEESAWEVEEVRKFLRRIGGFRSVTIIERERNFGLSRSIINGVTQLCQEFGCAIAIEDDVLIAPDFLSFINRGLDHYVDEPRVFSVCGFNYPITVRSTYPYDAFFSYRFACWGWGTWGDRWAKADWSVGDYAEFAGDIERQKRFNRGGDELTAMLDRHMAGKNPGYWDTVWGYTHSRHDAVAILPVVSRALNIGFDGSGAHRYLPFGQVALVTTGEATPRFPVFMEPDPDFAAEIRRLHRVSTTKKLAHYVLDKLRLACV